MHARFEKRIEAISRERESALYGSLDALAQTMDCAEGVPAVLSHAVRQLTTALSACPTDEQGQQTKLKLLAMTLPILEEVMNLLVARYRADASAVMRSVLDLLGEAAPDRSTEPEQEEAESGEG